MSFWVLVSWLWVSSLGTLFSYNDLSLSLKLFIFSLFHLPLSFVKVPSFNLVFFRHDPLYWFTLQLPIYFSFLKYIFLNFCLFLQSCEFTLGSSNSNFYSSFISPIIFLMSLALWNSYIIVFVWLGTTFLWHAFIL